MGTGSSSNRGSHRSESRASSDTTASSSRSSIREDEAEGEHDSPAQTIVEDVEKFVSASAAIIEKAKEFWNEIKDLQIPNPTEGKTIEQIIDDIIDHEWKHHSIDWRKAKNGDEDRAYEIKKARQHLKKIRKTMSFNEVEAAKSMGLLTKDGNIPNYDLHAGKNKPTAFGEIPSNAVPFVIWGWQYSEAAKFRNATDELVKYNICNLIRNFQVMVNDSTRMMVKAFIESGLWGLGLDGLNAVWGILSALPELTNETKAYAILEGITSVGENVIKLAIRSAILGAIVPLFTSKDQNAAAVVVVMNESNEDMRLAEFYLSYGNAVGVFKEEAKKEDSKAIIPKMLPDITNKKTGKLIVRGSIQAGLVATRKKDKALTGSLGVIQFEATKSFPEGIYIGWGVPYAYKNNRVLVSADYDDGVIQFSVTMDSHDHDNTQVSTSESTKGGKVIGRVNSKKGTEAFYIVRIADPPNGVPNLTDDIPNHADRMKERKKKLDAVTLPVVTSGKSADEIMEDILNHEKEHHGIDWRAAAKEGPRAMGHALLKAHGRLHKIRKAMNDHEVENAKGMGLLDANGNVKELDLLGDVSATEPNLAPIPDGAGTFACWAWSKEEAAKYQNATGDEIKKLVLNLIRSFQVMENSDENYLSHFFMELGLWGLGASALHAVWATLKIIEKVADGIIGIADGIIAVGLRVIQFAVSVFVLAILVPIFVYAMKDAAGVMVIINATDEDMNLQDLTATHGKVVGVFKENAKKENPRPIIPKMKPPVFNEKGLMTSSGAVFAGFFAARKNDNALVGSQGAFKFSPTKVFPKGVYIGWEVPLSQGNNRLLVSAGYDGSVGGFSDKTNDEDKQEDSSASSENGMVVGRVNSGSGSKAYYIMNIEGPKEGLMKSLPPQENVEEKAEKFWNEIKDLKSPIDTEGKTSDEVIADIIKHEKTHFGIDWEAAAKGGQKDVENAMTKSRERLQNIRKKMNDKEIDTAKKMGLLDSNGEVPTFNTLEKGLLGTAPMPDGAEVYPIWGWNEDHAAQFQNASGGRIKELVVNLIRSFQVMQEDDERMMTKCFMDCGLWALGGYGIAKVISILRTLYQLTKATEAYAIVTGIYEVGINVIKIGIAAVIIAILVPLFIYMKKDAAAVFVILNDTNEDLDLSEYHTTHGKIVGMFKENAQVDNPKPIIPKRLPPIINPKTNKEICKGSIQAGFFAARKKDSALVGSQGALKFAPTKSFSKGVYLGWEVPLSQGSNRLLVSTDFGGSISEFSDKTNDEDKQEDSAAGSDGAKVVGRVHDAHGSEGYYIFNITEPKKDDSAEPPLLATSTNKTAKAKGDSDDDLLNQIFEHEKSVNGIDWKKAAKEGKPAIDEAIKKARGHLQSHVDKMTKEELHHAVTMGLLNEKGELPTFDLMAEAEEPAMARSLPTVSIPSSAAPYMVWGWKPSVAKDHENAQGGDIKTKVLNLVRAFQAMKKDNKEQMVNAFMQAGIWGVGLTAIKASWRILEAAVEITEAVEVEAIMEGIAVIGLSTVTLAIAACILAVLVPIFIFMSKNAAGIMVIINDTDEDMRMIDLHATHGKIVGIFKEKAELDNPQPILPKRLQPIINPTTKKVVIEGAVTAGFFAARKRDNALYGSQGAMRFEATERYPQGVYLGWEVPLTMSSNRLLVSARYTGSASEFSNETNSHGEQSDESQSTKGAMVAGRVNSGSGSEAYYIFSIK